MHTINFTVISCAHLAFNLRYKILLSAANERLSSVQYEVFATNELVSSGCLPSAKKTLVIKSDDYMAFAACLQFVHPSSVGTIKK